MNDVNQPRIGSWGNVHSFTTSTLLLILETISQNTDILLSRQIAINKSCKATSHSRIQVNMKPYQANDGKFRQTALLVVNG